MHVLAVAVFVLIGKWEDRGFFSGAVVGGRHERALCRWQWDRCLLVLSGGSGASSLR
jgi:hypothetical protein